jgi:hypothetical protein
MSEWIISTEGIDDITGGGFTFTVVKNLVRCDDCRYANECQKSVQYTRNEPNAVTIGYSPIKWCSKGERRSE